MLLRSIGHIALATPDLDRLAEFYARVFGAAPEELSPSGGPRHCFIRIGETTVLHVFERSDIAWSAAPWEHGPIDHFTLEAADLDAFVTLRDRLVAGGHAEETVTDFGALVSVFFTDPDGLLLELSLWKTEPWAPPFATVPFRGRAGGGAAARDD
jgi:catechol 2,3-dioxygenase-like lactoylglutathione lyase family enzyme